jgi:NAD(P)H-dependent FMN reductase
MTNPPRPSPFQVTPPNPADLIAQRLCTFMLWASAGFAVITAIFALLGRTGWGYSLTCVGVFVLMRVTRPWWQKTTPLPGSKTTPLADNPAPSTAPSAPATQRRPRLLLLNAALAGKDGNSAVLLAEMQSLLSARADVQLTTLATHSDVVQLRPAFEAADGFVIATGTHWDSWSSVLQKLLEDATPAEGTSLWLGKPVAVIVSEHSTGGKGVLSRLQGVLVTLGCSIPPMSGLVLSRAAVIAAQHDLKAAQDFWCREDLAVVCHNLVESAAGTHRWKTWPVDRTDFAARWVV